MSLENAEQQGKNRDYAELRPYQFKPGQSGNPGGRPKGGESLKEYTKRMLAAMTEEERQDFLKGLPKDKIWEMAEGKPKQDLGVSGSLTISQVLDELEKDDGQKISGQNLENQQSLQDSE